MSEFELWRNLQDVRDRLREIVPSSDEYQELMAVKWLILKALMKPSLN